MNTLGGGSGPEMPVPATSREGVPDSTEYSAETVRVTIVGGGCAGLATAWQLLNLNDERKRRLRPEATPEERRSTEGWPFYEITVYEASERLGGKGASVRDEHGRILEHGLHVWLGFYENAFRMMRECYDEVEKARRKPDPKFAIGPLPHDRFVDAFAPEPHIGVASRHGGAWEVWTAFLPPMKGQPGDPMDAATNPFSLWGYLARALALAKSLMQSVLAPARTEQGSERRGPRARSALDEAVELDFSFDPSDAPDVLIERLTVLARGALLTSAAGLLQAASFVESWLREQNPAPQISSSILKFIEALATNARRQLQDVVLIDEEVRRKTEILDLLMTILIGLYRDRVFFDPRGLDVIDGIDYRDWLQKHGATTGALDSPLVCGIYDLVFAYRNGDHRKPSLSAAQALRGAMRMFFTYRGSMFWRLRSGMGDAIFAPLYRVMKARGVSFKFLHPLVGVEFDFEGRQPRVTSLRFKPGGDPQALEGSPLDAKGCWPQKRAEAFGPEKAAEDCPAFELNQDDFDAVVLAVGKDDFVEACKKSTQDPFKQLPAWKLMDKHVKTVGTRSAQVWMSKDVEELGWDRGPVIVAGLDAPLRDGSKKVSRRYETWADMTHILAAERAHRPGGQKPGADKIRSISYFCGVVPDEKHRADLGRTEGLEEELEGFLRTRMKTLWPEAYADKQTPLDSLVSADGTKQGGISDQYVRDNSAPRDRYTQSLPGSGTARISPLDPGIANMTVAGDWTDCGFNGGCVEAAVMSGMLAAHAISGRLDPNMIVGYHHP
ncbi:FAD-dependent oxidoreductase [Variovorax sp. GT1P44]|uniref:FAD-dependent oxidoreductase n=1 Tax=Variovorax sp. GT1P44 TaxID=3443742 RepID=UPI003F4901B3